MPVNPIDKDARFAQLWHIATMGIPSTLMCGVHGWTILAQMNLVKKYGYQWMRQKVYAALRAGYLVEDKPTVGKTKKYVAVQDKIV